MERVYDDRTNETLFVGESLECMAFMTINFNEDHEDFEHIWMEKIN